MTRVRYSIMKVKDWLKWIKNKKPDYEGFQYHVEAWEKEGMPYGFKDLLRIAKAYNCPLPIGTKNGTLIFEPESKIANIELKINILPTGTEFVD